MTETEQNMIPKKDYQFPTLIFTYFPFEIQPNIMLCQ